MFDHLLDDFIRVFGQLNVVVDGVAVFPPGEFWSSKLPGLLNVRHLHIARGPCGIIVKPPRDPVHARRAVEHVAVSSELPNGIIPGIVIRHFVRQSFRRGILDEYISLRFGAIVLAAGEPQPVNAIDPDGLEGGYSYDLVGHKLKQQLSQPIGPGSRVDPQVNLIKPTKSDPKRGSCIAVLTESLIHRQQPIVKFFLCRRELPTQIEHPAPLESRYRLAWPAQVQATG